MSTQTLAERAPTPPQVSRVAEELATSTPDVDMSTTPELHDVEEVTFWRISLLRINHLLGVAPGAAVPMAHLRTMRLVWCARGVGSVPHAAGHGEGDEYGIPQGYDGCKACQGPAEFLRVLKQRHDVGSPLANIFVKERKEQWWLTGPEMQREMRALVLDRVSVTVPPPREDMNY